MNTKRLLSIGIVLSLAFVLALPNISALLFLQDVTDISSTFDQDQTIVITVFNDEPHTANIELGVDPYSTYLQQYISIETTKITLSPNEKRNIQIETTFPSKLSPETHRFEIVARAQQGESARTAIIFTIEGEQTPRFEVVHEESTKEQETLLLTTTLKNTGNVNLLITPELSIIQEGESIDEITYQQPIQLLPAQTYPLTLRYDMSLLPPGLYELEGVLRPNKGEEISITPISFQATTQPTTKEKTSTDDSEKVIKNIVIGLLIIGGIGGLVFLSRESSIGKEEKLFKSLVRREQKADKELRELLNKTHAFIEESNSWIRKEWGEEYELR